MIHSDFVHLHLHTQYSLLDGAIRIPELVKLAREERAPALAITDHGNMFGAVEFYHQAQKAGIKPIIGCEVYVAPGSRLEKESRGIAEASYHLILLAKNAQGYANLMKLVTTGYLDGFYYRPRIDKEILASHASGLIALSACLRGKVPYCLLAGEKKKALEAAATYRDIFNGRFYLEVQENGLADQKKANEGLLAIGQELSLPLVATCDCHYLRPQEARFHDILLCIQTGKTVNDQERLKFGSEEFYFKSAAQMKELFSWHPEAIKNTLEIAERCNLELHLTGYHLPQYSVPESYTLDSYLKKLAQEGLAQRLALRSSLGKSPDAGAYDQRLQKELATIQSMGLASYFLIVADFINYAKASDIPVGPGRGSAAGSLVAYVLRITEVDPLEENLLFERFLTEGRKSLPDIDVDFAIEGREEVIRYVTQKYGADKVAQITTFGTMQARAVIRDVGRALDMPYGEVDRIAKLVPPVLNITLEEALAQEPRLKIMAQENSQVAVLMEAARVLEGLTRHASTHAAGVVISDRALMDYTPLYKGPRGEVLTQYDMESLERIGLVKFDFLSLKTLTVIDKCLKLRREARAEEVDLSRLPDDDKETFARLRAGDTNGVFQLEGRGITDLLVKMRPERLADINALIALYRPGPLQSGMAEEYVQRKLGKVAIEYEAPELREILKETYGVILYQEQVMKIATDLANFTPEEADLLRYAMGKKVPEEMSRQKELFLSGAKKKGISERKATRIFDLMAHFAGYGFNKSHSAAYAVISYQTAYLKAHYPVEFMAALLSAEAENSDKVMKYVAECREKGIEVLPPDINESQSDFAVREGKIHFGLVAVKNVGQAAVEAILQAREAGGRFSSFLDFCQRVDLRKVNRRVVESLIKAGAFDSLAPSRSFLLHGLRETLEAAQARHRDRQEGQISLFSLSAAPRADLPSLAAQEEEEPVELKLAYEKEVLGLYLTDHPLRSYGALLASRELTPISELADRSDAEEITIAGLVVGLREKFTKKGQLMAFLTLEDLSGRAEVIVFSDLFRQAGSLLEGKEPIVIQGVVDQAEEGTKIKASRISSLSSQRKEELWLHMTMKEADLDRGTLAGIREALRRHPGRAKAFVHLIMNGGREAVISLEEAVTASRELVDELEALLGSQAVKLKPAGEN